MPHLVKGGITAKRLWARMWARVAAKPLPQRQRGFLLCSQWLIEPMRLEKSTRELGYLIACFVESEVTGVEQMHFGRRHVVLIGGRACRREGRIVLSPDDEDRRLLLTKPRLPFRIRGDVGAVVVEKVGLNVRLAGSREKFIFALPGVRIVAVDVRARANVALPR